MNEFVKEVGDWHLSVFPRATATDISRKVLDEATELVCAVEVEHQREETADVVLTAFAKAGREGWDLEAYLRNKFEINKQRAIDGRWENG